MPSSIDIRKAATAMWTDPVAYAPQEGIETTE